eukprot:2886288-Amphidinium_carterae.1
MPLSCLGHVRAALPCEVEVVTKRRIGMRQTLKAVAESAASNSHGIDRSRRRLTRPELLVFADNLDIPPLAP